MNKIPNASDKTKDLQPLAYEDPIIIHLHLLNRILTKQTVAFTKSMLYVIIFFSITFSTYAQTNLQHVKVSGYYRKDGTYVQPYFRTAPNSTNRDNFSTKGNTNPYTGKPGWIDPDSKFNTFYYSTYTYPANNSQIRDTAATTVKTSLPTQYKNRTYIEDEFGKFSCYLTIKDERTYNIYDMNDELILFLVVNHRGDWRIFDNNWIYIKTIFVETEK